MNNFFRIVIILSLLSTSLLSSCGAGVTETCNPTTTISCPTGYTGGDTGIQAAQGIPTTYQIVYSLCETITACYDEADYTECVEMVNESAAVIDELGLVGSVYQTFDGVQSAVTAGTVVLDETQADVCLVAIEAVSCAQIDVLNAYDGDYANTQVMVPDACASVYD